MRYRLMQQSLQYNSRLISTDVNLLLVSTHTITCSRQVGRVFVPDDC